MHDIASVAGPASRSAASPALQHSHRRAVAVALCLCVLAACTGSGGDAATGKTTGTAPPEPTAQRLGISMNPASGFIEFVSAVEPNVARGMRPEVVVAFAERRIPNLPESVDPACSVSVSPDVDYEVTSTDLDDYVVVPLDFPGAAPARATLQFSIEFEFRVPGQKITSYQQFTAQRGVAALDGCGLEQDELSVWYATVEVEEDLPDGTWSVYPVRHIWTGEFRASITKRVPAQVTIGTAPEVYADTFSLSDAPPDPEADGSADAGDDDGQRPSWSIGTMDVEADEVMAAGTTRTVEWAAARLGFRLAIGEAPESGLAPESAGCAITELVVSAPSSGSCTVFVRAGDQTGALHLQVVEPNGRTETDRPGPNVFDLKPLYVLFEDSPDMQRDSNGELADYVQDLADFMAVQNPGHTLRIDTANGVPDVQLVRLPITQAEFLEGFTDGRGPLDSLLAAQGIANSGDRLPRSGYEAQHRIYVGFVEGPRGAYDSPGSKTEGGCGASTGLAVQLIYLRELDGSPCGYISDYAAFDYRGSTSGSQGFNVLRLAFDWMRANPGCDAVLGTQGEIPLEERPGSLTPYWDIIAYGYRTTDQPPRPAELDPTHQYYFDIKTGPRKNDPCYDIIFSPYWAQVDQHEQVGLPEIDRIDGRAFTDRPDEVSGPQVHFVYVLAADSPDQRLDVDGTIDTAITTANEWLFANGGKRVRVDTFLGKADVTFVRLDRSQAEFWLDENGNRCTDCPHPTVVYDEVALTPALASGKINILISPIGPSPASWAKTVYCAISDPRRLSAFISVDLFFPGPVGPGCDPVAVTTVPHSTNTMGLVTLHELFHVLGAVDPAAPNGADGHIAGDTTDLMGGSSGTVRLDPGRDDYWDGGAGYLDLSRSVLMVPTDPDPIWPPYWTGPR